MSMAFWSKFESGHWTLTQDSKVVARAIRRHNRWIWEIHGGLAGMADSLDAAMLAVGRVRYNNLGDTVDQRSA